MIQHGVYAHLGGSNIQDISQSSIIKFGISRHTISGYDRCFNVCSFTSQRTNSLIDDIVKSGIKTTWGSIIRSSGISWIDLDL